MELSELILTFRCRKCGEELTEENSYPNDQKYRTYECKYCRYIESQKYRTHSKRYEISLVPKFTDEEKGWDEAAIDGEGCLTLWEDHAVYRPWLQISNTNMDFLRKGHRILNAGSIYTRKTKGRRKPLHHLVVVRRADLRKILEQLSLVVKEKQRLLLLEFIALATDSSFLNKSEFYSKLTRHDKGRKYAGCQRHESRILEIVNEIRSLNK